MSTEASRPHQLFGRLLLGMLSATLLWVASLPCAMADSMDDDCHAPRTCIECSPAAHCPTAVAVDYELPDFGLGTTAPTSGHVPTTEARRWDGSDTRLRLPAGFDSGPPPSVLRLHLRYSVLLI